jgi:hypothetical protein
VKASKLAKNNFVKDDNGDLLAEFHNIFQI